MDINDPYVQMVDNYLERVILQQGEVVLDAARRLSRPHMHLTSMINKILQMMREKGIEAIMPGTVSFTTFFLIQILYFSWKSVFHKKTKQLLSEAVCR